MLREKQKPASEVRGGFLGTNLKEWIKSSQGKTNFSQTYRGVPGPHNE
jgi:hypothetical protein